MLSPPWSTQRVTRDRVGYRNLRVLHGVFVAISEWGLCRIDIQQTSSWTPVNSGRFLGGQRREVTGAWPGSYRHATKR